MVKKVIPVHADTRFEYVDMDKAFPHAGLFGRVFFDGTLDVFECSDRSRFVLIDPRSGKELARVEYDDEDDAHESIMSRAEALSMVHLIRTRVPIKKAR
jgi:hypothetical protein